MFKSAIDILVGLPIGVFSQKKMRFIVLSIYTVIIITFYFVFIPFRYEFPSYQLSLKIYVLLDPFLSSVLFTFGFLIGSILTRNFWKANENVIKEK